jgi:acetyl esterase
MTLNPALQPILDMMAPLASVDWKTVPTEAMRAMLDTPMALGPPIAMARVENLAIDLPARSLAARLYVPEAATRGLTVFFHGGGWVIGTLDTHDSTCRALAKASGAAVLSIGYRLAPEHRYPAAVDDCYEATVWAAANAATFGVDATRLAVAGDSAGGNLAAAVAIKIRDAGGPALAHQLLIYPVTDARFDTASYTANGGGNYFLSTAGMERFWSAYLGDLPASEAPLAAILHTPDLANLPPATVITAEYDPLRDEGQAYAARLMAAGVAVDAPLAPGMIHGFFAMFEIAPAAQGWVDHAGANLAAAFAA